MTFFLSFFAGLSSRAQALIGGAVAALAVVAALWGYLALRDARVADETRAEIHADQVKETARINKEIHDAVEDNRGVTDDDVSRAAGGGMFFSEPLPGAIIDQRPKPDADQPGPEFVACSWVGSDGKIRTAALRGGSPDDLRASPCVLRGSRELARLGENSQWEVNLFVGAAGALFGGVLVLWATGNLRCALGYFRRKREERDAARKRSERPGDPELVRGRATEGGAVRVPPDTIGEAPSSGGREMVGAGGLLRRATRAGSAVAPSLTLVLWGLKHDWQAQFIAAAAVLTAALRVVT